MRITRNDFINQYDDKAIGVDKVQSKVSDQVGRSIARADLNGDGKIQGHRELDRLFTQLDHYDRNGRLHSVETTDNRGRKNALGRVIDAVDQSTVSATQARPQPRTVERPQTNDSAAASRTRRTNPAAGTAGMSESQKYDHYRALIEENGGRFKTGSNQRNLISLRKETNTRANGGRGVYDDRTAMLWTDAQGRKHVREYTSNTEPSARYEGRYGVDANGDGRKDLGRLPAGHYEYRTGHSSSLGKVLRPTQSVNAERDTNHDGWFRERARASAGQSMLFHAGGNSMTGSAGCQTMSPAEYNRFWRDLNLNGNPGNIGYTLINL
jgi:hypothetical protein